MRIVKTYEQFMQLKNDAVKFRKLRITNLLMPENHIHAAIDASRLTYEDTGEFLTFAFKRHATNFVYLYCGSLQTAEAASLTKPAVLSYYGSGNDADNQWKLFAEKFGMEHITTALRMSAKSKDLKFEMLPDMQALEQPLPDYNDYREMLAPYFDTMTDNILDEFEYAACSENSHLLQAYEKDGIAGFCFVDKHGKKATVAHIAVYPEFRGRGVAKLLLKKAFANCEIAELWVQDRNIAAKWLYTSVGLQFDSNYHAFWEIKES